MLSSLSSTIRTVFATRAPPSVNVPAAPSRRPGHRRSVISERDRIMPAPVFGHRPDPSCDILRKGKRNPIQRRSSMRRDAAESLAVQALGFLAGVLDHVASEDALVT